MSAFLPLSIEQQLKDLGLSLTEVLILRRLFESSTHTLRSLAKKTGKSTGVLDQAMKKLVDRGIVLRTVHGDQYHYALSSHEALCRFVEEAHAAKKDELERREENFRRFIEQLTEKKSPEELVRFDSKDLCAALSTMLNSTRELCIYTPSLVLPAHHPLSTMMDAFHRERIERNIFLRVIAPMTQENIQEALKDSFNKRSSLLLSADRYPIAFERILTANSLLCIDLQNAEGRLIQFPSLALHEYQYFLKIWTKKRAEPEEKVNDGSPTGRTMFLRETHPMQKIFLKASMLLVCASSVVVSLLLSIETAL